MHLNDTLMVNGQPRGLMDRLSGWHVADFDFGTVNDEDWTIVGDGTVIFEVSATSGLRRGGWLRMATRASASDEDEVYFGSGPVLPMVSGKPWAIACRLHLIEAATNAANIIFGALDSIVADSLVSAGAGPIVNADKAVLYKVDGTMYWHAKTAKATGTGTNVQTTTNAVAFASATTYELAVCWDGDRTFTYWVDNAKVATHPVTTGTASSGVTAQPTADMCVVLGVKAGTAAQQGIFVDWLCWASAKV